MPQPSFSGKLQKALSIPPIKRRNIERRSREYLTPSEVKLLIETARSIGRYGARDSLLILMAYRHAFRVGEIVDLKWDQVDLDNAKLHVDRLKNGDPSVHYLEGDELRALRKLHRQHESAFVFCSERNRCIRICCGTLKDSSSLQRASIQAYFGHKNIQHIVTYTKLDSSRFKGFGKDL